MFHGVVGEKNSVKRRSPFLALVLMIVLLTIAGPVLSTKAQANDAIGAQPAEVLALLNQSRAQRGLGTLEWSDALAGCAQVRSVEISTYFSHTRPNGAAWYTVNPDLQYGENLLYTGSGADASYVLNLWVSSPAHSALFYDASYRTCALAKYTTGGSDYWVIEFGY